MIASAGLVGIASSVGIDSASAIPVPESGSANALRRRIALSDLIFTRPADRSEAGTPIGNGRMGSLVWTTPSRLRLQVNRVDLYPAGAASCSFVEAHNDYSGGCAFVDIDFKGTPFAGKRYREHLSVYDGTLTIEGEGVTVTIVATRSHDAFAIAIVHRRAGERRVQASLRMLRFAPGWPDSRPGEASLRTRSHLATSKLHSLEGAIALSQQFVEADFRSSSAVAIRFADGKGESELLGESEIRLTSAGPTSTVVLVGSAASIGKDDDLVTAAREQVDLVARAGVTAVAAETQRWWHDFWRRGSIGLGSADGTAQAVQQGYHFFLYLMACSSAGSLPPKFNGMLWNSGGDQRAWGAQHWFTNTSCYYEALLATGRFELMAPFFAMYEGMAESCTRAASDIWGSQGMFIPETVHFDRVETLPAEIAAEMRALNLGRKPWAERSAAFRAYAETKHPYSSLWNWKAPGQWRDGRFVEGERGHGPYGPTSHIFAASAKIAYLFWQRYEFTQDRVWLERHAYPMLRGAVEFYRHHPLVSQGADGRVHISGTNNSEPVRGVRDSNEDLSAMRGVAAVLIRASTILGIDAAERIQWQAWLDKLAPLPTSAEADALGHDRSSPAIFSAGRGPAVFAVPDRLGPDPNSMPSWFFDLCGVETSDPERHVLARATFESLLAMHGPVTRGWNGGLSKLPIAAALLGDHEGVRALIPTQMNAAPFEGAPIADKWQPLRNRLNLGEGAQALSAQHLGRASEALHLALLQSNPPAPGEPPILHLFPAWPRDWDADFRLHVRGGFIVEAAIRGGEIGRIMLESQAGASCRLRNPFAAPIRIARDGREAERLTGDLINFPTRAGEHIRLARD
jgi:hypothetical protein